MTTGERIKKLRTELGLSQDELGKMIGVKNAAIYKYEKGLVVNLKRDTIAKLASALNTTPAYLMGLDSLPAATQKFFEGEEVQEIFESARNFQQAQSEWADQMADFYPDLNELGRKVALERVEELTDNPKYSNVSNLDTKGE